MGEEDLSRGRKNEKSGYDSFVMGTKYRFITRDWFTILLFYIPYL